MGCCSAENLKCLFGGATILRGDGVFQRTLEDITIVRSYVVQAVSSLFLVRLQDADSAPTIESRWFRKILQP
jgi:hypothetical protein